MKNIDNKSANQLLIIIIIFTFIGIMNEIVYGVIFSKQLLGTIDLDTGIIISNVMHNINNVSVWLTGIFSLIIVRKLRANEKSRKYYKPLIIITIANIVISIISFIIILVIFKFFPEVGSWINDNPQTYFTITSIYFYILLIAQVVLYVLILFKEGTKINWMILGKLTAVSITIARILIDKARYILDYELTIYTGTYFDAKFPLMSFISTSDIVKITSEYLWVIGAIIIIIEVKKIVRQQKLEDSIDS